MKQILLPWWWDFSSSGLQGVQHTLSPGMWDKPKGQVGLVGPVNIFRTLIRSLPAVRKEKLPLLMHWESAHPYNSLLKYWELVCWIKTSHVKLFLWWKHNKTSISAYLWGRHLLEYHTDMNTRVSLEDIILLKLHHFDILCGEGSSLRGLTKAGLGTAWKETWITDKLWHGCPCVMFWQATAVVCPRKA